MPPVTEQRSAVFCLSGIDFLVIAVAVFAAFAWGSNESWAIAVIGIVAAALLAVKTLLDMYRGNFRIPTVSVFIPVVLFLLYVVLQWQFWTLEPYSTGLGLLAVFSYTSILYLAATGSLSRSGIRRMVLAVLILGSFEAVYGLIQYLGDYDYIWNYRRNLGESLATGTMINRNHYALLLNVSIASAVGYLYYRTERLMQGEALSLRKLIHIPGSGKLAWILLWIVLMGTALIFSMSRTGIAALFFSVAMMMFFAKIVHSKKRVTVIGLLLLFAIVGLAVYTGIDEVIARYESISTQWVLERDRAALWRDAWPLAEKYSVFGSGLGTFQWTYPAYESFLPDIPARYAHNDYLQALIEAGIVGLGLVLWAFIAVWRIAYINLKNAGDPLIRGIGLATMGVLTAVAVQEITDFGLHIPGVSVLVALLVGLNLRARAIAESG